MKWNKIKEKCPKAFAKLIDWDKVVYLKDAKNISDCLYDRDLYDFFDEQGVYVSLSAPTSFDEGMDDFEWSIFAGKEFGCPTSYSTRTEAEEKAFEKAFSILEAKL